MKIIKNNQKKKKILTLASIITLILLVGAAFTYVYAFNGTLFGWSTTRKSDSVNYGPPSQEEVSTGQDKKNETANNNQNESNNSTSPKTPEDSTPITPPAPTSTIDITITSVNQNGAVLQVRTLIGKISSSGTCTAKLVRGTQVGYSASVSTQAYANSSTCKGFDIPITGIASGTWTLVIEFTDKDAKGSTSQEVKLQ